MSPEAKQIEEVRPDRFKKIFSTWVGRINPGYTSSIRVDAKSVIHVYNTGGGVDIHCIKGREHYTYTSPEDCASYIFSILSPEKRGEFYRNLRSNSKEPYPLQTDFRTEPVVVKGDSTEMGLPELRLLKEGTDAEISKVKTIADTLEISYPQDIGKNLEEYNKVRSLIQERVNFLDSVLQHKLEIDPSNIENLKDVAKKRLESVKEIAGKLGIEYSSDIDTNLASYQKTLSAIHDAIGDFEKIGRLYTIIGEIVEIVPSFLSQTYKIIESYTKFPELGKKITPFLKKIQPVVNYQRLVDNMREVDKDEVKRKSAIEKFEEYGNIIRQNANSLLSEAEKIVVDIQEYMDKNKIIDQWIGIKNKMDMVLAHSSTISSQGRTLEKLGINFEDNVSKITSKLLSAKLDEVIPKLTELEQELERLHKDMNARK